MTSRPSLGPRSLKLEGVHFAQWPGILRVPGSFEERCFIWSPSPRTRISDSEESVPVHSQTSTGSGDWIAIGQNPPLGDPVSELRWQVLSGACRELAGVPEPLLPLEVTSAYPFDLRPPLWAVPLSCLQSRQH